MHDAGTVSLILHAFLKGHASTAITPANTDTFCLDLLWGYRFAREYHCVSIQNTFKFWLEKYLQDGKIAPLDVFIIAAKEGLHELAAMALSRSFKGKEREGSVESPWGRVNGKLMMSKLNQSIWEELPGRYLFALSKVFKKPKGTKGVKEKKDRAVTAAEAERKFLSIVMA